MTAATRDVYVMIQGVRRRGYSVVHGDAGYAAEWITRGTGVVMYRSKTCNTKQQAIDLALKWIIKHPQYRDTTDTTSSIGTYRGPGRALKKTAAELNAELAAAGFCPDCGGEHCPHYGCTTSGGMGFCELCSGDDED